MEPTTGGGPAGAAGAAHPGQSTRTDAATLQTGASAAGGAYPQHWEADVVLDNGRTCHIRPIRPADGPLLHALFHRCSPESRRFRFFVDLPDISEAELQRFTHVDFRDRVALVALVGEDIVGVGRFDRDPYDPDGSGNVAFLVEDRFQRQGIGGIFLEHLAQAGRERRLTRFTAEVLPDNRSMLQVFARAGYRVASELDDGYVEVALLLEPTRTALDVQQSREHRAQARSVARLLAAERVLLVVEAGDAPARSGAALAAELVGGGARVPVVVAPTDGLDRLEPVPSLAVMYCGAETVRAVIPQLAAVGVDGIVLPQVASPHGTGGAHPQVRTSTTSAGTATSGSRSANPASRRAEPVGRETIALARRYGMRVLGPAAAGIRTSAGLAAGVRGRIPRSGSCGLFTQSAALGARVVAELDARDIGRSSTFNVGLQGDLSANDVMRYWQGDDDTAVCALHLESVGNPRKFLHIIGNLSRSKPVVLVQTTTAFGVVPHGHVSAPTALDADAVATLFEQAGVIRVPTMRDMASVVAMLQRQPLPAGGRVSVVGDDEAVLLMVADAMARHGLDVVGEIEVVRDAADLAATLAALQDDPAVDAIAFAWEGPTPLLDRDAGGAPRGAGTSAWASGVESWSKPVVVCGAEAPWGVGFADAEDAARVLAAVVRHGRWRASLPAAARGEVAGPELAAVRRAARAAHADQLGDRAAGEVLAAAMGPRSAWSVAPSRPVGSLSEALEAMRTGRRPCVLKATAPRWRDRADLATVFRHIRTPDEMRAAWSMLLDITETADQAQAIVQDMVPVPAVPFTLRAFDDQGYGPLVAVGVAGYTSEVLGDVVHAAPPRSIGEARAVFTRLRAAPLFHGYRHTEPVDLDPLAATLVQLGRIVREVPEVTDLRLHPVYALGDRAVALNALVTLRAVSPWHQVYSRRLWSGTPTAGW